MRKLTFIDLFAGIGGFHVALKNLGLNCVFSSEIDPYSRKMYKDNFGEMPEGDITKVPLNSIPSHDVLCAGFPCQPFSISGKKLGFKDTRGTLFYNIAKIAEYHSPKILFLENVKNFEKHNNGYTMKTIINTLSRIGYDTYYEVLNASHYGIPQSRERIYILAFRKDLKIKKFNFIEPNYEKVYLKDILLSKKSTKKLNIERDDIRMSPDLKELLQKKSLRPIRLGIVNKGGQGERIYSPKGHSITLSAYGGGVGAKTGLYYINGTIRKLHVEECKRLMTFPENYTLTVPKQQLYKQFGNAVIVKMIDLVFSQALKELNQCQKKRKMQKLAKK